MNKILFIGGSICTMGLLVLGSFSTMGWYQTSHVSNTDEKTIERTSEIRQLTDSECDCEKQSTTRLWNFPILCAIFGVLFYFVLTMPSPFPVPLLFHVINFIGRICGCSWAW